MFAIASGIMILAGAVLGRFFKVLILFPVGLIVLAVITVKSIYLGQTLLHFILEAAALITCLEIGFVSVVILEVISELFRRIRRRHKHRPSAANDPAMGARRRHNSEQQ